MSRHTHRANAAERAIQTFKQHFLSGLATCDKEFPIIEWDCLIEQCEMTLNLLQKSRCNPNLLAYTYLNGVHDYKKVPLAPPGTKVIIHKPPNTRASWAYHGKQGWYVGPALHHYRCYRCFLPKTGREIITNTVKFIPNKITFPTINYERKLENAFNKILNILQHVPNQILIAPSKQELLQQTFTNLAKHSTIIP